MLIETKRRDDGLEGTPKARSTQNHHVCRRPQPIGRRARRGRKDPPTGATLRFGPFPASSAQQIRASLGAAGYRVNRLPPDGGYTVRAH